MKAKKRKKNLKIEIGKAKRVACSDCKIQSSCNKKERKESFESNGKKAFCMLTPNKSRLTLSKLRK